MSPTPAEFEAAAIDRIEDAVRAGMPLMVALHAERAHLASLPLNPAAAELLERLVRFSSSTHDFDKTPTSVRLAFDRELVAPARELLTGRRP